jgi:tRNA splicing ligase
VNKISEYVKITIKFSETNDKRKFICEECGCLYSSNKGIIDNNDKFICYSCLKYMEND